MKKTYHEYHMQNRPNRLAYMKKYNKTNWPKRKEARKLVVQAMWDYKLSHPCIDCEERDPILLEFDHIKGKKHFALCDAPFYAWATVLKEISKCVVRCVSCHRKKTFFERKLFKRLRKDQQPGGGANG